MACDTRLKPRQTLSQRKAEVRKVVDLLSARLAARIAKVKVGPQGAIAFEGLSDVERDGVTDACAYRMLMVYGSAQAKLAVQQAEMLSGRKVQTNHGLHSHDGGHSWHGSHKH